MNKMFVTLKLNNFLIINDSSVNIFVNDVKFNYL